MGLAQRHKNAGIMRQLKLALCRWRLDYQKAYHDQSQRLAAQSENSGDRRQSIASAKINEKFAEERAQVRNAQTKTALQKLRRAVLQSWSGGNVPVTEIHRFVGRVVDTVAQESTDGKSAEPLLKIYTDELGHYGALPLLDHTGSPDVL